MFHKREFLIEHDFADETFLRLPLRNRQQVPMKSEKHGAHSQTIASKQLGGGGEYITYVET